MGGVGLMPGMSVYRWRSEAAMGPGDPIAQRWSDSPVDECGDGGRRWQSLAILAVAQQLV
jgi:hypothetical protein